MHYHDRKRVISKAEKDRKKKCVRCRAASPHRLPAECLKHRDTEVNILQLGSILCAEKSCLSLQTRVSLLFSFIYLFSSSLIFVESCPKQLYGATWQIYGSQNVHRERLVSHGKWEIERKKEGERKRWDPVEASGWAVKSEP